MPPVPRPRDAEARFTEPSNIWLPIDKRRETGNLVVINLYETRGNRYRQTDEAGR